MFLRVPKQPGFPKSVGKEGASEDFLRAIVDACASNVAVLDETGVVLYASKAWHLLGFDVEVKSAPRNKSRHLFQNCRRLSDPQSAVESSITLRDDLQRILTGDEREFHRAYFRESSAGSRVFVMHAARLNLPGPSLRVLITHEAVSPFRGSLHTSQERLTELLNTTQILAWEGKVKGQQFTYVSDHAVKMLGYSVSAWYEPNFLASHIHPDDRSRVLGAIVNQAMAVEQFDITFRMLHKDGSVIWVQNVISITHNNGADRRMHGFMIDISERKRSEEALNDLSSRLIEAQEDERKRVARELHDDLNQRLAVLSIELEQFRQYVPLASTVRKRFKKLQLQVQEISTDIQRLSHRLHPSKLDHLGLFASVKSLCEEISQVGGPKVHFLQAGFPAVLPKDVTLCTFRIAQELLRNCLKHSGAQSIEVVLRKAHDVICLSVSDDGCGFDTRSVTTKGLGFISIKERLRIVGGNMKVCSKEMVGTRIEVTVPLSWRPAPPIEETNLGVQNLREPGRPESLASQKTSGTFATCKEVL